MTVSNRFKIAAVDSPIETIETYPEHAQALARPYKRMGWHPYRYFLAGGETLQKIESLIDDARAVEGTMQALITRVGAAAYHTSMGAFELNAATPFDLETVSKPYLYLDENPNFYADLTVPNRYFPMVVGKSAAAELANWRMVQQLNTASGAERDRLLAYFKDNWGLENFDGEAFVFTKGTPSARYKVVEKQTIKGRADLMLVPDSGRFFCPDVSTPEGMQIIKELEDIEHASWPLSRLNAWMGTNAIDTNPHSHPRFSGYNFKDSSSDRVKGAIVQKIDGQWVIGVPVAGKGLYGKAGLGGVLSGFIEEIVVPPDCTQISVSQYFAMLEKTDAISFTPQAPKET